MGDAVVRAGDTGGDQSTAGTRRSLSSKPLSSSNREARGGFVVMCCRTQKAILAARPTLSVLAFVARSAVAADSPTKDTAGRCSTMTSDQNVVFDVTGYDGDVTKIVETIPSHSGGGALISRLASYQGLILMSSERSEY